MIFHTPISLRTANRFVDRFHRHHKHVVGHKFAIAVWVQVRDSRKALLGVAIVGRPVARGLDDGTTFEVTRLCIREGCQNLCSYMYAACARICKEMGCSSLITYILDSETGISLKGAGWIKESEVQGRSWDTPSRRRVDKHPTCNKVRWRKRF